MTSRDVIFDERPKSQLVEPTEDEPPSALDPSPTADTTTQAEPNRAEDNVETDNLEEELPTASPYPVRKRHSPSEWWKAEPSKKSALAAFSVEVDEPKSYEQAQASELAHEWKEAMDDEISSLMANDTWKLEAVPPGVKPISAKWVYKVKRDTNGNVERFKARLVAKGFQQVEGIDFNETYASTPKYSTFRTMMAKAAQERLHIHKIDIKTAFLQGDLEERIYMEQPRGYEVGGPDICCHLKKPLYGLKQAPRAWHEKLDAALQKMGAKVSEVDAGLYTLSRKSLPVWILVFVDDILVLSKDESIVKSVKADILRVFEGRDLGVATSYLGIAIERDNQAGTLKISNKRTILDLVDTYGLEDAAPRSLPLTSGINMSEGDPLDTTVYPYRQLVGSLMHLAVTVRPDISFAVGLLSRHLTAPTTVCWQAAKGVLRYLAGTADDGITYSRQEDGALFHGYCDADYAGDLETRRSTSGHVFIYAGGAIIWLSKRQPTVSASTAEAEYVAAGGATKEGLWFKNLMHDLGITVQPVNILADNQSAIKLLRNPIACVRSKHIDVIHHMARERVMRGEVAFQYVSSSHMIADIFTKPLGCAKHRFCCEGMGMG